MGTFTKREQKFPSVVGIGRIELPQGDFFKSPFLYSASASSGHPTLDIPLGASLIAFTHASFSTKAAIKFQCAAGSGSAAMRIVRKADDSGDAGMYVGVSASAARMQMIPDLAASRFVKAVTTKSFGKKYLFGYVVKG